MHENKLPQVNVRWVTAPQIRWMSHTNTHTHTHAHTLF